MKKLLMVAVAGAGAAYLAKRFTASEGGVDFGQVIERMPEGSPPRWMFSNISAIRENTDRILELLEGQPTSPSAVEPPVETPLPPPVFPPPA